MRSTIQYQRPLLVFFAMDNTFKLYAVRALREVLPRMTKNASDEKLKAAIQELYQKVKSIEYFATFISLHINNL